jgi:transcription initiation factor TFIIH subunit 3
VPGSGAWPAPPPLSARTASLSACLSLALLYSARRAAASARVVVFQAGADVAAHYIPMNNAVAAAAARRVLIDACVLGAAPSVFLQQAAQGTGARCAHPPARQHAALAPFLSELLLADAAVRARLLAPPAHDVNLRAHCFCHQRAQSLARLCTTCLSVWCESRALKCETCG